MLKFAQILSCFILASLLLSCSSSEQPTSQTVGLFKNDPQTYEGYVLVAPTLTHDVYLMDNQGRELHSWHTGAFGTSAYLLPDGNLLRCAVALPNQKKFGSHGSLARIELYSWEGKLLWYYEPTDAKYQLHHDIAPLPNGNILAIAFERLTPQEIQALGRDPALFEQNGTDELWMEAVFEIQPDYATGSGGKIVWAWHTKDHLVQDHYPDKADYLGAQGVVEHPELINLNYISSGIGANNYREDWLHFNSIDYDPQTDQITLSSREFSEFWIIDHSTTTQEASGHEGGKSGKGGDLLYRYGNPQTHGRGSAESRELYYQHDAQRIPPGLPGAGNILVFDNGGGRPDGNYSIVKEIKLNGEYSQGEVVWSYQASPAPEFFSSIVSSAQRLPNGNTLIDQGASGRYFEVTSGGKIVWEYINPVAYSGILQQGTVIPRFKLGKNINVYENLSFRVKKYPVNYSAFERKVLEPRGFLVNVGSE